MTTGATDGGKGRVGRGGGQPTHRTAAGREPVAGVTPPEAMAFPQAGRGASPAGPSAAELVGQPAPIDEQLSAYAATGDHVALCEFAEALARHRDQLWARAGELAAGEMAAGQRTPTTDVGVGEAAAGVVPPAAVAACLAQLVVESGDDIATVGAAVGVDPAWARGVLTGEVAQVEVAHVQAMCAALEATPEELFGPCAESLHLGPRPMTAAELAPPAPITAAQELVDVAGFLATEDLLAEVRAMGGNDLAKFARALATRHSQLECWADDLAVREEPAAVPLQRTVAGPTGAGADVVLPAAAVAAQFEMLVVDSGDDLDTVARSLGFDPAWVSGVVDGTIDVVDADRARQLCDALDLDPVAVFGASGVALESAGRWAVVPYDPFLHEALVEVLEPLPPTPPMLDLGP